MMTAYTLDVPSGWKFAGTIARDPGCHSKGASLKYTMQSTDGLTGVVIMPGVTWNWRSNSQMQKIMASSHCCPASALLKGLPPTGQIAVINPKKQFWTPPAPTRLVWEPRLPPVIPLAED